MSSVSLGTLPEPYHVLYLDFFPFSLPLPLIFMGEHHAQSTAVGKTPAGPPALTGEPVSSAATPFISRDTLKFLKSWSEPQFLLVKWRIASSWGRRCHLFSKAQLNHCLTPQQSWAPLATHIPGRLAALAAAP